MKEHKIKNVKFLHPIMNAAGCHCTTKNELSELSESFSSAVVSKSSTIEHREGNIHPRYYENNVLSINSTGLANNGYKFYNNIGKTIKKSKPYFLSVAGIEKGDNLKIIHSLQGSQNFDFIELNLSCPNVIGKPQIGYDSEVTYETLRTVFEINSTNLNIGLKLPPYFDMMQFHIMADIFKEFPISFLTCINSLGNGFVFDENYEPSILPKNGYGGIGGLVIKPFGLSNVRKFHEILSNIPIIGCGGITKGRDIYEYLLSGATLVQVGTQLVKEGPSVFRRLLSELIIELDKNNKKRT